MTNNLSKENTDLRAQLIAALKSCLCSRRRVFIGPDWIATVTIGECISRGECGCDNGDLIKISQRIAS